MPLLTIFIPAYNIETYIANAISSVIAQTFEDWHLIVIDDASTDSTFEAACEAASGDARITVIKNEVNLGMLQNWNKGVSYCNTPFFIKLDGDDKWHPELLKRSVAVLNENKNVGIGFCRYINVNNNGNEVLGSETALPEFAKNRSFSTIPLVKQGPDHMLAYPVLRQGLSVMRKAVFEKVGVYKYLLTKETQAATDTEFYFRAGAHFDIFCIDAVLYYYRIHNHSISATDAKDNKGARKLYELKVVIINYYYACGFITKREKDRFLAKVFSQYAFTEIAAQRNAKAFKTMFKKLLLQALMHPGYTISFYCGRVSQKLINGR